MAFRRCTVRGRLPGDVWQFGFTLQSDEDLQIMTDAVAGAVNAYVTARALDYSPNVAWDDVVCSELETGTGRVIDSAQAALTSQGTRTSAMLPGQNALCVSILPVTGIDRGRFYLPPMTTTQLALDGALAPADRATTATALGTLFDTLSARTSPARLGIWRAKTNSYIGARALSVGSVWDTQRRRRNKRLETRTTETLAI